MISEAAKYARGRLALCLPKPGRGRGRSRGSDGGGRARARLFVQPGHLVALAKLALRGAVSDDDLEVLLQQARKLVYISDHLPFSICRADNSRVLD